MATKKLVKKRPLKELFITYDKDGEFFGSYTTERDAHDDAWGPRCKSYRVIKYVRV